MTHGCRSLLSKLTLWYCIDISDSMVKRVFQNDVSISCLSNCSNIAHSPYLSAVIMNMSAYTDFEHLLSKQHATPYCSLVNDKILTKKEMQQSSQHGSGLLGFDERFHGLAAIQRPSFFSGYLLGFTFFQLHPNNRKEAVIYFCLMLKQGQPLKMTNRLMRLLWPAAEPTRLTAGFTPSMAGGLFTCGETQHSQTAVV